MKKIEEFLNWITKDADRQQSSAFFLTIPVGITIGFIAGGIGGIFLGIIVGFVLAAIPVTAVIFHLILVTILQSINHAKDIALFIITTILSIGGFILLIWLLVSLSALLWGVGRPF